MSIRKILCIISFAGLLFPVKLIAQGFNHVWLHGSTGLDTNVTHKRARILFDLSSDTVIGEDFKMAFNGTESTISDANGNFLFASNGCWIMDATGDTMMNGTGINPGIFTDSYNSQNIGEPLSNACIILTYSGDSTKFVMFHQTADANSFLSIPTKLYYSVIDMTLNAGLGAVINNQKNLIAIQSHLSAGFSACKHANGRDWWILAIKDSSNVLYKVLFTPIGIASVDSQTVNMPLPFHGNAGQPTFSPDGTKFAYTSGRAGMNPYHDVRIFSFDRCTGILDSIGYKRKNNEDGFGLAFSPNSQYLYFSSFSKIYQFDTDAPNIASTIKLVATYDGYCYPFAPLCTNFWLMYLAANSKIYISSDNFVIDMHYINFPDSADTLCDVHQHDLRLPCYSFDGGIYHPNYYLGPVAGSVCDSLGLSVPEINHNFNFRLFPNPTNGNFNISYLLPKNKDGKLEIFDIVGKHIYSMRLPLWSTLQKITLPKISEGLYSCVITSGMDRVSKKIAVIKD